MSDCLFCKIIQGDIPSDPVYEDELIYAFNDINPQAPTHVLIIPKAHIATLNDVDNSDILGHMMLMAKVLAKELELDEDGYRVAMNCNPAGGQEVYHIHLHLLGGRQMTWPPG